MWLLRNIPFLFAILIDGITIGIIFPLLDDLQKVIPEASPQAIFSLVLGIYMFAWAYGNALISALSDRIGRRRAFIIAMGGKVVAFLVTLGAFYTQSLTLLIIGRLIDGGTNGTQPAAEAVALDICPDKKRLASYLGFLLLPIALGDLIGSAVYAYIGRPMLFGAGLSLIALLLFVFAFKETYIPYASKRIHPFTPFQMLYSAFKGRKIALLSLIFLLTVTAWSGYFNYLGPFVKGQFHFSTRETGYLIAIPALAFLIGWGAGVPFLQRFMPATTIFILNKTLVALAFILTILLINASVVWFLVFFAALCNCIAYVALISLFATCTDSSHRGWMMGVVGALHFGGFGLSALLMNPLFAYSPRIAYSSITGIMLLSVLLMIYWKKEAGQAS